MQENMLIIYQNPWKSPINPESTFWPSWLNWLCGLAGNFMMLMDLRTILWFVRILLFVQAPMCYILCFWRDKKQWKRTLVYCHHMKLASSILIRLVQSSAESVCGIQVLCLNYIVSNFGFMIWYVKASFLKRSNIFKKGTFQFLVIPLDCSNENSWYKKSLLPEKV